MAEAGWRSPRHQYPTRKDRDDAVAVLWSRGGGWTEAEWLQGAAVEDGSAHGMPWAPCPKGETGVSAMVFSLKAAADYASASRPTDKHPVSQDTQGQPAAPEES